VVDDPDADCGIVQSGRGLSQTEVLGQTITADRDRGESFYIHASGCLTNPVVEDLWRPDQGGANDVGMDVNAVVWSTSSAPRPCS